MNIKMIRRKATVFGVAIASMFGAPLPMMKKAHEDEEGDPGLRVVNEEGIIASEDIVQGEWFGFAAMDDYLYLYGSLENLVDQDNEVDGKFWKTATLSPLGENKHIIRGVRSDDVEFSLEGTFDLRDKLSFDQLCRDFNKNLKSEVMA
jgi:hypothetical protein